MFAQSIPVPAVEWADLGPQLILLGGTLVLMVVSSLLPRRPFPGFYAVCTVAVGLAAGAYAMFLWHDVADDGPRSIVSGALGTDGFSVFFTVLLCATVVLAALLADGYLRREGLDGCELYVLILLSGLGGVVMASANDLVVLFLGLETLSIALYVQAASHLRRVESQEAALKYFVLGGFSSAFFLYGVALVYGATGSTSLVRIAGFLGSNVLADSNDSLLLAGFALLLVGLGFKVAAAPFHSWAPDVYQGSPTPVAGYMAAAAKAAAFAALLRVFYLGFSTYRVDWRPLVWALAVLTLVVGSVLAAVQTDVKRLLAYSSISHAGFILVGVQAASAEGTASSLFYLFAYAFMALGSFGVLTVAGRAGDGAHGLDDYRGLARRRPALAFAFTVFLLAQAGVPFTTGFLAKFKVIGAAVEVGSYPLAVIAMLAAVVAAFLYLKVVVAVYLHEPDADAPPVRVPVAGGVALALALGVTVAFGIAPSLLVDFARDAVPTLVALPG